MLLGNKTFKVREKRFTYKNKLNKYLSIINLNQKHNKMMWMELEFIMLREITQSEKDKIPRDFPYM